jgi:hypothetical protein
MLQIHKCLNIFSLGGEAQRHRGLYEKQYIWELERPPFFKVLDGDINRARCIIKLQHRNFQCKSVYNAILQI